MITKCKDYKICLNYDEEAPSCNKLKGDARKKSVFMDYYPRCRKVKE